MRKLSALLLLFGFLLGPSTASAADPPRPAPGAAPAAAGDEPNEDVPNDEVKKEREPKPDLFDSGRLLATSGVTELEGAGGGGLVPWALITGYGTRDAVGANAHYTYVRLSDFEIHSGGVALGLFDRVELSATHLEFNSQATGGKLGLGRNFTFDQDVFGAKVKLLGDAVYDQDSLLPQISAGLQFKANDRGVQLHALGAKHDQGTDYYVSATKVLLGQSLLLNATLRETKANQYGFLGFGGDRTDSYTLQYEVSAALLLTRQAAVGAEFRTKPNNLSAANEGNAYDIFGAYFFNKNISTTLAFVDLGDIATQKNQRGVYLSMQVGF